MLQATKTPPQAATRPYFKAIMRELYRLHAAGYHTKYRKINNSTIILMEEA